MKCLPCDVLSLTDLSQKLKLTVMSRHEHVGRLDDLLLPPSAPVSHGVDEDVEVQPE